MSCACADEWEGQAISAICTEFRLGLAAPDGTEEGVCVNCAHAPECHTGGTYTRKRALAELRELVRATMALLETSKGEELPQAIRRVGEALVPFAWALDDEEPSR